MEPVEIKDGIYWVGAIDWDVRDFHGYSTPVGTTYNAYLVMDDKITVFDTVKAGFSKDYFDCIGKVVDPERIDYMVVNHAEMDHTGAFLEAVERIKPQKIFCSANGKKALLAHFHRDDLPYEVVASGQEISLGKRSVRFIETKMLHWPDSMFSYIESDKLLLSQDAFGLHWATTERFDDDVDYPDIMREAKKYYANILLPYSSLVRKLLADVKTMGLQIDTIAPDHGVIWRSCVSQILQAYDVWSAQECANKAVIVYDTMWHSTEQMAHAVADGAASEGTSVKLCNMRVNHRSDVMTDLLDAKAILLGSPVLNNGILPRVADMICYMKGLKPAGRIGATFGSYGWGSENLKHLDISLEEMKIEAIDPGIRVNYVPTADDLGACFELGRKVAVAIRESAHK